MGGFRRVQMGERERGRERERFFIDGMGGFMEWVDGWVGCRNGKVV
jgi:hypothetical protein